MNSTAMTIRTYQHADETGVMELWQRCGLIRAVNNPYRDIQRKLAVDEELFLVGIIDHRIVATVMAGYDGHRGAINYVGVHPDYQRRGLGKMIMREAERRLTAMGCPKINLHVLRENKVVVDFYRRLGYEIEDRVQMGKEIGIGSMISMARFECAHRRLKCHSRFSGEVVWRGARRNR